MKLNIVLAILVGLVGYGLTLYFDSAQPPAPTIIRSPAPVQAVAQTLAPNFSFTDISGREQSLRGFDGKIVILNFWASWCAPCIKEFPLLLEMAERYKDKAVMIALSSDFDSAAMNRFLDKLRKTNKIGENVYIAHDQDAKITADIFGTFRLPETLIIDQNQRQIYKFIGARWTADDFMAVVDPLTSYNYSK